MTDLIYYIRRFGLNILWSVRLTAWAERYSSLGTITIHGQRTRGMIDGHGRITLNIG
jgi:hypothetical protein